MKRKFIVGILTVLGFLFLTNCSYQNGYITNYNPSNPTNYKIICQVRGESKETYFMGIPLEPEEMLLIHDAKNDLFNNAALKENQALINITVDNIHTTFFMIISRHKVVMYGDKIEYFKTN